MKKIIFLLIFFPAILCNGCKKEDLTDTIDITKYSWKVKSITINDDKSITPNKDYHGDDISNDNAYKLVFQNDSVFLLNLGINDGEGKYKISSLGKIDIEYYGVTKLCCDSNFDECTVETIKVVTSYQVLDNILLLKGDNCEIELKQE